MRPTQLGLLSSLIMAAMVVAGCNGGDNSAGDSAKSGGGNAAATAQPTPTSATPSDAPAINADNKTACTNISGEVETTMAKVSDAEKIGPPAGHSAVSAQYSAGATSIYVHMFTASGEVNDAAEQVATAMSDLADKWATAPKKAPSKANLDTAIKQLKAACSPS